MSAGVHLYDGVTAGTAAVLNVGDIHAALAEHIGQNLAVCPNFSGMKYLCARPGGGNGLIEALSAAVDLSFGSGQGFTGGDKVRDMINIVHIQRSKC